VHKVSITAGEISKIICGKLISDPNLKLEYFCEPKDVDPKSFCFLLNEETIPIVKARNAGLVIVPTKLESLVSIPLIVVKDKSVAMAKLLTKLFPTESSSGKVDSTAIIALSAKIGKRVEIGAHSVIGEDTDIGDDTIISQNVVVGNKTKIGTKSKIYPNVTIYPGCEIGNKVLIHAGCVIGSDGFGYAKTESGLQKIKQIGKVVIEDCVEIGANSCIDRATIGSTRIGFGSKIDNQVQIGHNCSIGKFNVICGQVGIAGSVTSGDWVVMAGQVGVADHLKIGDKAVLGPTTMLSVNVEPGQSIMGDKGYPAKEYLRRLFLLEKLHEYVKRIKALEAKIFKQSKEVASEKALDQ
jgi:UDP-3-O-[3-hydroxymyristoyl] glucosamine N-acyltransferase